jgi:hypothetical protein
MLSWAGACLGWCIPTVAHAWCVAFVIKCMPGVPHMCIVSVSRALLVRYMSDNVYP